MTDQGSPTAAFERCQRATRKPSWKPASYDEVRDAMIALSAGGVSFSLSDIRHRLGRPFCDREYGPIARHVLALADDPEAFPGAALPPLRGRVIIEWFAEVDL
jgi:hypothetical protein